MSEKVDFKTKYEFYEWLVIQFEFTNVPNTFMRLMTFFMCNYWQICSRYFYLFFILEHSKSFDDHIEHLNVCLLF